MPQILLEEVSKTYFVAERVPGATGFLRGLIRRRRPVEALRQVSFALEEGALLGLIGPNGAGKSTAIKILSGILLPSSGHCTVDGLVPWRDRVRHVGRIGVVFGQRSQLWWDLPVSDSFALLRDIYRVKPAEFRVTIDRLIGLLRIESLLSTPVRQLSLGQRMRCEIAAALLHRPAILFLDEPTIGLDAPSKLAVRDVVRTLNRDQGVTVILTTHDMQDIEALARRVIVIGKGSVLIDGTLEAMRAELAPERRLVVDFAQDIGPLDLADAVVRRRDGRSIELGFDPRRIAPHTLISRIAADYQIADLRIEEPAIEEVIAGFYALHGAGEA